MEFPTLFPSRLHQVAELLWYVVRCMVLCKRTVQQGLPSCQVGPVRGRSASGDQVLQREDPCHRLQLGRQQGE